MAANTHLLLLLFVLPVSTIAASGQDCVYTLYVRTGSIFKGGTDSIITVTLCNSNWCLLIRNLEKWGGLMGPDYNYFERGNLDIFSGRAPCLNAPVCALNLTSDGTGPNHGWYCSYVEVTRSGPNIPCSQQLFTIDQWLATDEKPYELTAISNNCSYVDERANSSMYHDPMFTFTFYHSSYYDLLLGLL